jgi:pimeloyl-ACP methyl ester carboxylesterase
MVPCGKRALTLQIQVKKTSPMREGTFQVASQNCLHLTKFGISVTERFVTVSDGAALKVFEFAPPENSSEKPLIVFIAGWISEIAGWGDVLNKLIPFYKIIYVETREKRSAIIPKGKEIDFSIFRMIEDIHEILDACIPRDRSFVFVASSLGATAVLDYLSRQMRKPELTIAIAPNGEFSIPGWGFLIARYFPPAAYFAIKGFIIWYLGTFRIDKKEEPEQFKKYERTLDAADPYRLKASAVSLKGYSLYSKLPQVNSPVVVVGAQKDRLHGIDKVKKIAEAIPGARFEIMESNRATHSEKAGIFIVEQLTELEKVKE